MEVVFSIFVSQIEFTSFIISMHDWVAIMNSYLILYILFSSVLFLKICGIFSDYLYVKKFIYLFNVIFLFCMS